MNSIFIEIIGSVGAFCTTIAYLPQLIKIIKTRSVKDVSLNMYLVMLTGVTLWLIYGAFIKSWPLIAANAVTFIFVFAILILKRKWK